MLKGLGDGQERILNFGMFSPVSIFLLSTMNLLHSWTGSYAIAIIILTLCIRGVLWPIQNKATASMRQMQELQPRMTELKEKYKDDPTRMNTEVMKLYKEYNVNPLAGCLPMFIQMPDLLRLLPDARHRHRAARQQIPLGPRSLPAGYASFTSPASR